MRHKISTADLVYRYIISGKDKVFSQGWGDPERIKDLLEFHLTISNRDKVQALLDENPEIIIDSVQTRLVENCTVTNGHFLSPVAKNCPGLLPEASKYCYFQFVTPLRSFLKTEAQDKAVAIHLAGTGDQYFARRRYFLADPLINLNGVSSVILENPFYGTRRPEDQIRSNVNFVCDIFSMGAGLMLESLTVIRWLERLGYGPFCITGVSMGGHMASLCATNYPKPIAVAPCLSWTTASPVFTRGVMANSINWDKCDQDFRQYNGYSKEVFRKLVNYDLITKKEDFLEERKADSPVALRPRSKVLWVFIPPLLVIRKVIEAMFSLPKYFPAEFKRNLPSFPSLPSFFNLGNTGKPTPYLSYTPSSSNQLQTKCKSSSTQNFPNFKGKDKFLPAPDLLPETLNPDESSQCNSTSNKSRLNNFYYHRADMEQRERSLEFMRRLMDHFTHLSNFEKPVDPALATIIAASFDGYVLRDGVASIEDLWPGCTVHYVNSGHVVAFLKYQHTFRRAICDSLEKHRSKYYPDGTPKNPPSTSCSGDGSLMPNYYDSSKVGSNGGFSSSSKVQYNCPILVPEIQHGSSPLALPPNYTGSLGQNQHRSLSLFVNQATMHC